MPLFAVIRTRDAAWLNDESLEGQQHWQEHANFMDGLVAEGSVILGGPLEGTPDFLLVMQGQSAQALRHRLNDDPWTNLQLLRISSIARWALRLGILKGAAS